MKFSDTYRLPPNKSFLKLKIKRAYYLTQVILYVLDLLFIFAMKN